VSVNISLHTDARRVVTPVFVDPSLKAAERVPPRTTNVPSTVVRLSDAAKAAEATSPERIKAEQIRDAVEKVDFHNVSGQELSQLAMTLYQSGALSDTGGLIGAYADVEPPRTPEEKFDLVKQFDDTVRIATDAARTDPSMRDAVRFAQKNVDLVARLQSFATSDRLRI